MNTSPVHIPVRLAGEPGVRYGREPLSFGVPFADGTFPTGTALRCVTADGRELPLQTAVMTTWNKDLQHVKWLLADLQADPSRDGETVWLEANSPGTAGSTGTAGSAGATTDAGGTGSPGGAGSAAGFAIATTAANGLLTIDTGALRLTLRTAFDLWRHRECDSPFARCQIKTADGWRDVLHGPGILLYMKDQQGNLYTSLSACPAPKVVVEEQGPLRVCVLITGHLTSEQGVRFCPYRLRIHLSAGKADLRIFHTFIFDQDPTRFELAAIGLKVLAKAGDGAAAAVGGEKAAAHWSRNWRELSLIQTDDRSYATWLDGAPFGVGGKAAGWAALGGGDASVVAAVRDFWQEYPKGFKIERDALDVGVWPDAAARPLSFLTPFREPPIRFNGTRDEAEVKRLLAERPTAPLALSTFGVQSDDDLRWIDEVVERLAPERAKSYCDFMGCDTGIGAAKTTEVVLRFTAGPVAVADASAFAAAVQEPLAGIVDPGYLCGTDAFGCFLPAGHPSFTDLDRHLTELFEKIMIEPLVRCRRYGMMLHGHMVNAHGSPTPRLYHLYKDTAPEKALRYVGPFNNEALDLGLGVWGQFLRTGERRYLRQAQITACAVADVSFVHAYPGHEERIGCIHYHGPHAWSNGLCWSHSETGFMMADYYLTGNRRMREVALEVADGVLDKVVPSGIVNCFARLYREFTGPLAILIEAYQATWHEKYGEPARRSLNWLLRTVRTPGWLPQSVYTRGPRGDGAVVDPESRPGEGACNPYHVFDPALRLFPSPALRDFVLAQAEYSLRHGGNTGLCQAYDLTRDPRFAAAALDGLQKHKTVIEPDDVLCFYSFAWSDELPRQMKTVVLAAEADPANFREFARKFLEEREGRLEKPPATPADQKPQTNLGVLSTEAFVDE